MDWQDPFWMSKDDNEHIKGCFLSVVTELALNYHPCTLCLWRVVFKIFIGFKTASTWSIKWDLSAFEKHNEFLHAFYWCLYSRQSLRQARVDCQHWCSFWVTQVQKSTLVHSCMIAGNCVFPEKCSWKGKSASYLWVIKLCLLTKWGGFVCLFWLFPCLFFVVGLLPQPPICFLLHPHAYQCRVSTRIIFALKCLKTNMCIVRKKSFHLKPYNRADWKAHH